MLSGLKKIWAAWKKIAQAIGNFQARVLLTVIYSVLILPFGLAVRLFSDPLRIKQRPTAWLDCTRQPLDLEQARRQ